MDVFVCGFVFFVPVFVCVCVCVTVIVFVYECLILFACICLRVYAFALACVSVQTGMYVNALYAHIRYTAIHFEKKRYIRF